jgi:hypothetical protein
MDKATRDMALGVLLLVAFVGGMWAGSTIKGAKEVQARQAVIDKAVEAAKAEAIIEQALTCEENELIEAIKNFAVNGVHLKHYYLSIDFAYEAVANTPAAVGVINTPVEQGGV